MVIFFWEVWAWVVPVAGLSQEVPEQFTHLWHLRDPVVLSLSTGGKLGLPSQPGDLRVVGILPWHLASMRECSKRSKVKASDLLKPGLRDYHCSSLYWSKPFTGFGWGGGGE